MKQISITDINGNPVLQLEENDFGQIEGVAVHEITVIADGKTIFTADKEDSEC